MPPKVRQVSMIFEREDIQYYVLKSIISFLLVLTPILCSAELSTEETKKLKEIQSYTSQSLYGDRSKGDEFLEDAKLGLSISITHKKNGEYFTPVTIIKSKDGKEITCQTPNLNMFSMIKSGNSFVISNSEYNEHGEALAIYKVKISNQACELVKITSIPTKSTWNARMFDKDGKIGVTLLQPKGPSGRGHLEVLTIDHDGKQIEKNVFSSLYPSSESKQDFAHPSYAKGGLLVPLIDSSDPEKRTNLYCLNGNKYKLVLKNAFTGEWIDDSTILANRGAHANASELLLVSGKDFSSQKVLNYPTGFKNHLKIESGKIHFINTTMDNQSKVYTSSVADPNSITKVSSFYNTKLEIAHLPSVENVKYQSGDHLVASVLSIPKDGCDSAKKRPVIVYLHGGAYSSDPIDLDAHERLFFTQLGYVVLDAGYYGDEYKGSEFRRGTDRYIDRDKYIKTLQDIQTAGEFAKTIPCADPSKIILMGHSHGTVVASLYATAPEYASITPYAGIILKNGRASEQFIVDEWNGRAQLATKQGDGIGGVRHADDYDQPICCQEKEDIVGVAQALKLLSEMEKIGKKVSGVPYTLTNETFDAIVPERRVRNIFKIPLFYIFATDQGGVDEATRFEKKLRENSSLIQSWHPQAGHVFEGDIEIEFVEKVNDWIKNIKQ